MNFLQLPLFFHLKWQNHRMAEVRRNLWKWSSLLGRRFHDLLSKLLLCLTILIVTKKVYVYMAYPVIWFIYTVSNPAIGYHQEKPGSSFTTPSPPDLIRFSRLPFFRLSNPSFLRLFLYLKCPSRFIIPVALCWPQSSMPTLEHHSTPFRFYLLILLLKAKPIKCSRVWY